MRRGRSNRVVDRRSPGCGQEHELADWAGRGSLPFESYERRMVMNKDAEALGVNKLDLC
jgi:hypothetical protein